MSDKQEFDMYDFLKKDVTGYDSMYEILGGYIPELKGDFSLANLINTLPKIVYNIKPEFQKLMLNEYKNSFIKFSSELLNLNGQANGKKALTEEENKILLDKMKKSVSQYSFFDSFNSIDEFIEYSQNNVHDQNIKDLRDIIIDEALEKSEETDVDSLRIQLMRFIYFPIIEQQLKEKYPTEDRNKGIYEEWDLFSFIKRKLTDKNSLNEYDSYLKQCKKEDEQKQKEIAISIACKNKRNNVVVSQILDNMTDEERADIAEKGFTSSFFNKDKNNRMPKKGKTKWYIEDFDKPIILCDTLAEYSKDAIENQRVIAISYGKFHYDDGISDNSLVQPDLIGVTRIGKDGVNTYFVLAPLDTINFKNTTRLKQDEKRYNFYVNGRKTALVNAHTGKRLYGIINSKKIPEDLEEFYAKIFFSDLYLDAAVKFNNRYIGYVSRTPKGNKIVSSDIGRAELDAAEYASRNPGMIGKYRYPSLEMFCSSRRLEEAHLKVVRDIAKRNDKIRMEKMKKEENDDNSEQGEPR